MYRYYEYGTEAVHIKSGLVFPVYFGATKSEKDDFIVICIKCKYLCKSNYDILKIEKNKIRTWEDFEKMCETILDCKGCKSVSKKWSWDVKGAAL